MLIAQQSLKHRQGLDIEGCRVAIAALLIKVRARSELQ